MPSVLLALATTVSMCWLNLALCCTCSVMPKYFVEMTDVFQHLVVELLFWWLLVVCLRLMVRTLHLHVPLLFPLFHLLEVSLQLAMYYKYTGPFHIFIIRMICISFCNLQLRSFWLHRQHEELPTFQRRTQSLNPNVVAHPGQHVQETSAVTIYAARQISM